MLIVRFRLFCNYQKYYHEKDRIMYLDGNYKKQQKINYTSFQIYSYNDCEKCIINFSARFDWTRSSYSIISYLPILSAFLISNVSSKFNYGYFRSFCKMVILLYLLHIRLFFPYIWVHYATIFFITIFHMFLKVDIGIKSNGAQSVSFFPLAIYGLHEAIQYYLFVA